MIELGKFDYDNPKCPKCHSKNLEYGSVYEMDEAIRRDIHCNSCELELYAYVIQPRYWEIWTDDNFFHIKVENGQRKNI